MPSLTKDQCISDCKENWENVYMNDSFEECIQSMTDNYGCGASCGKYTDIKYNYNTDLTYKGEKPWVQVNDDCWIDTFLFGLVSTECNSVFNKYIDHLHTKGGKATEVGILISNYIKLLKQPNAEEKQILKFKLIEVLKDIYNDEGLSSSVSKAKACKYSVGSTVFLGTLFKKFPYNIGYYLNENKDPLKDIISKTCHQNTNDIVIIDAPSYSCEDCREIKFTDIVKSGKENGYLLKSIVIGNNIHYVNYSKINNIWMYYDNQSMGLLDRKSNNDIVSFNNSGHPLSMHEDITLFFLKTEKKDGGRIRSGHRRASKDGKKKSGHRRRLKSKDGKGKKSTKKSKLKQKKNL